jgi:23S rRNA-/tRNA-specific pseudouridylate synthase
MDEIEAPHIPILYENERIVAVDKPHGWLSVPSREGEEDARWCLGRALESQLSVRLWPVHRLDVPVSGLIVFAKDADAHKILNAAFEQRVVHKRYEAWSQGEPGAAGETLVWRSLLMRGKRRAYVHEAGKPAVTVARWIETIQLPDGPAQRWLLDPETGRSHQLRVHMAANAGVLIGDALYGSPRPYLPDAIALRAIHLDLSAIKLRASLSLPEHLEANGLQMPETTMV